MEVVDEYLNGVSRAVSEISRQEVEGVVSELFDAWSRGATIFIFGNGGSSATASHMANDLNKQASVDGARRLRALALTDNVPLLTAWANDSSFDNVFVEQMLNFLSPGDVALGISTSGESRNVLQAIRAAHAHGARTIGLTGRRGGTLKTLVDCCVHTPTDDVGQQEDLHLILNHAITVSLRRRILETQRPLEHRPAPAPRERSDANVKALVLCAGTGSRLGDLTASVPKPMLPIAGKPLLEHTVEWLRGHGITDIAFNLHHRADVITKHFGDGRPFDVQIVLSHEEKLLGTAGAAKRLAEFLGGGRFVVVYGDVLTDLDLTRLLAVHDQNVKRIAASGGAADDIVTLSLYRVPDPHQRGIVELDAASRVVRFVEKPSPGTTTSNLANAGVFVAESGILNRIPPDEFADFGFDIFPRLIDAGTPIFGCEVAADEFLADIGTPDVYALVQTEWVAHQLKRAANVRELVG